jgi:hydrazine synthase alpha subunit-like protein/WD40 repeat protein
MRPIRNFLGACGPIAVRLAIVIALAAARTPVDADTVVPDGAGGPFPIVLTQVPASAPVPPALAGGMLRRDFPDGSRLVVVSPLAATRVLTPEFAAAADPEVSFDGTRILFAGRKTATDPWCVYEMRADGGGTRLVTCGPGSARAPISLTDMHTLNPVSTDSWTQIAFVGGRPGEINEAGTGEARGLYTCLLDGTVMRRLTYNLSSDIDPALLPDGRLVYASWQRQDLRRGPEGRVVLLAVNMDGTDMLPYVTDEGLRARQMPAATESGLVVFVEADALAGDGGGRLASVSMRRPLHSYRSLSAPTDGLFAWPAALPDGRVLVSMRPADGRGDHGVWRLDPVTGSRTKLFDAPGWHDVQAKPLAPRRVHDGRSSPVRDDQPEGTMYVLDVSINDLPEGALAPGVSPRLRVLEGLPRRADAGDGAPLAGRRLLGEAPIASDGSAQLVVPADTPVLLQVVDDDGLAQQSGAWIWARNHYEQGCVGCHEDPERTPPNRFVRAIQEAAASLDVPAERRRAVDFRNDVLPIVRNRCLPCHGSDGAPPRFAAPAGATTPGGLGGSDAGDAVAHTFYLDLLGAFVDPGRARASRLVWHLFGRNMSRPWDGAAASAPAKPMPATGPRLTDEERRLVVEWIDFGAAWDSRPPTAGAGGGR